MTNEPRAATVRADSKVTLTYVYITIYVDSVGWLLCVDEFMNCNNNSNNNNDVVNVVC